MINITSQNIATNNTITNSKKQTKQKSLKVNCSNNLPNNKLKMFNAFQQYFVAFQGVSTTNSIIPPEELTEFVLPNNLDVVVDTHWKNNETDIRFNLVPTKNINTKPSVPEILDKILEQTADEFNSKSQKNKAFQMPLRVLNNNYSGAINGHIVSDYSRTQNGLSEMIKQIYYPQITESNLTKAKTFLKTNYADIEKCKTYQIDDQIRNGNFEQRKNNIDNVTIADIQNYYNELLSNAEGKMVISMPKAAYNSQKDSILNILSNSIPKLNPFSSKDSESNIDLIIRNEVIEDKQSDKMQLNKYYSIKDENTIKDKVVNSMMANAIKLTMGKTTGYNYSEEIPSAIVYSLKNNSYMDVCVSKKQNIFDKIEKKSFDANRYEQIIQSGINKLITTPLSYSDLKSIKELEKEYMLHIINDQSSKSDILINQPLNSFNYINDYNNTIDSITSQDIQQMAQKIFSQPSLTVISTICN